MPESPGDIATFGASTITSLMTTGFTSIEIDSIIFQADASPYTIATRKHGAPFIEGAGIINESDTAQNILVGNSSSFDFGGSATVGSKVQITVPGTIDETTDGGSGTLTFLENSSAGDGPSGDGARLRLLGNAHLYIGGANRPGFSIGSLEGDGGVFLGFTGSDRGRILTVGNFRDTTFSGFIDDMGAPGSVRKTGSGSLTLTGANTYLNITAVQQGELLISNTTGSGTGNSIVYVNGGSLGGTGTIAGPVTIGKGHGPGAAIAPGARGHAIGTLTIQSPLVCHGDASYRFDLDTDSASADQLVASGVTIDPAARFSPTGLGTGTIAPSTVFIVLQNTSAVQLAAPTATCPTADSSA